MNWKQFKTWLDKNIIESEGLTVKIREEKWGEYGELSTTFLTNLCDSLEATLDNDDSYFLLPNIVENRSFREQITFVGKKTNCEAISEKDYEVLEKLFDDWKSTQINGNNNSNITNENNANMNTRNILLIGRTGGGKSTLGNVLINKNDNFEEVFGESSQSVSETRIVKEATVEIDISRDGSEKVKYRIIDTIGLGDTKLTPQGVLTRLAEVASWVKSEGLNHIFFVTQGRFSKEEIEAYDLLSSIIFDKDVLKYTTIVRTNFPNFEKEEVCANDRAALRMENADLAHILGSVNVIYVDNPPLEGRPRMVEMNKELREESRKRLLTYLAGCQGNYRPSNIDELDQRVNEYKTNEQKLKDKMKEMDADRKRKEEEFRKKLVDMKEEYTKELRENKKHFDEELAKSAKKSEKKLEETKKKLEEDAQRKLDDAEQRAKEREKGAESRHKEDLKKVEESQEKIKKDHQEDLKKNREETDNLRKQLNEKKDNADIATLIKEMRVEDQKREDKRDKERRDHELKVEKEKQETERKRIEADTQRRKEEQQAEAKRQELERKKANMDAAWKKWEADNEAYLQEQRSIFWGFNKDDNWQRGLPKPSTNLDDY